MGLNAKEVLINELIKSLDYKGNITDGSHTFDELYHHRTVLFSYICNSNKELSWKSRFHDDGTFFKDYFIVGVETPEGNFTYHDHNDKWDLYDVKEIDKAPKWDGHESKDVVRVLSLLK